MHSKDNKELQKILAEYVLVNIDLDTQRKQIKGLGVEYIPLMIFYSPEGQEKHRKTGSDSPAGLLKLLKAQK